MRSLPHFLNLVEALERHGVRIGSSSDGLDHSTSTGCIIRNILASVAEFRTTHHRMDEGGIGEGHPGRALSRPTLVKIDLGRFLRLMEQSGMTKAKACGMLGYLQGIVNNRLKEVERSG